MSLVQISCQTNDKKSVLVIAVDRLSTADVNCSEEIDSRNPSGLQLLCKEAVRFTHAYTPSTLSAPALASILTGLYPYEHEVRHNGGPGLAPEFNLSSELAVKKDYRTSFFSGGAPILRRTGLNQGFEIFDDNISPQVSALFRTFKKTTIQFLQWLKTDSNNSPYFSFIYVPDLAFTTHLTSTNLGEIRNLSFESQLDELNEGLFNLFQEMKKINRWDDTTVILVGLNGHNIEERIGEFETTNLHSENTQVALLIKLALHKKRDEAIHWKFDQNISLSDLGHTLFELLGESHLNHENDDFPTYSLVPALKNPVVHWPEDRPLLIESGWPVWRHTGPLKTAAIANHVLYINSDTPQLFNTLMDRFEINPLPLFQESVLPITTKLQGLLAKNQFEPSPPSSPVWKAKLGLPYSRWMKNDEESLLLKDLKQLLKYYSNDADLQNWTAAIALELKDWNTLKELGKKYKNGNWEYIAEKNLMTKGAHVADPCFKLLNLTTIETHQLKACNEPLFLELIDWIHSDLRGLSKELQKKKFERSYRNHLIDQQIERTNIALGLSWDTKQEDLFSPLRTDLILSTPELVKYRNQIIKAMVNSSDL